MDPGILVELRKRKSPLVFEERDIEEEKIDALVDAARWAPSCFNNQSWNYVFVHKDSSTRKAFEEALSLGMGGQGRHRASLPWEQIRKKTARTMVCPTMHITQV